MHGGLDLAAEKGRVVWAAAKGYVVRAAWTAGYGLLVEVRHNGELTTRYSHLSALLCQPGDEVAPGRPVGLVGNTGRSTGPHLHFEVWESGLARDPLKWLGDEYASHATAGDASN
jgi:murein DD-endopeptidase MepM/ murein hydrolase activator NlpD